MKNQDIMNLGQDEKKLWVVDKKKNLLTSQAGYSITLDYKEILKIQKKEKGKVWAIISLALQQELLLFWSLPFLVLPPRIEGVENCTIIPESSPLILLDILEDYTGGMSIKKACSANGLEYRQFNRLMALPCVYNTLQQAEKMKAAEYMAEYEECIEELETAEIGDVGRIKERGRMLLKAAEKRDYSKFGDKPIEGKSSVTVNQYKVINVNDLDSIPIAELDNPALF